MTPELTRYFDECAAASFDRQLCLAEVVGDRDWHCDLATGILSFGEPLRWAVQLLGTESEASNTWLWAWANPSEAVPVNLLGNARLLQLLGEQRDIPEFTASQFPLGDLNGHFLALVARGLCRAVAYFRAPYDGGAAYLLLHGRPLPFPLESPASRIASVFPRVVADLPITNHKRAFLAHLSHYGLAAITEGDALVIRREAESILTAVFDEQNRLTRLKATLAL